MSPSGLLPPLTDLSRKPLSSSSSFTNNQGQSYVLPSSTSSKSPKSYWEDWPIPTSNSLVMHHPLLKICRNLLLELPPRSLNLSPCLQSRHFKFIAHLAVTRCKLDPVTLLRKAPLSLLTVPRIQSKVLHTQCTTRICPSLKTPRSISTPQLYIPNTLPINLIFRKYI